MTMGEDKLIHESVHFYPGSACPVAADLAFGKKRFSKQVCEFAAGHFLGILPPGADGCGLYFCVYCYANTSKDAVLKNKDKHNADSESIIG